MNKVANMERRRTRDAILSPADLAAGKRLREAWDAKARERGLTQDKMAELLGGTQGLVSHYLNQRAALNYRVLLIFAKALDIDSRSIRDDLPEQALTKQAAIDDEFKDWRSVLGYAQAAGLGDGAAAQEYAVTHKLAFRADSLSKKHLNPDNLRVMYGKGDSMEPTIKDGDAILFDLADATPRNRMIYVLLLEGAADEEYNVKRCKVSKGVVTFVADNPDGDHDWKEPRPAEGIKVIGRVRWTGGWVK